VQTLTFIYVVLLQFWEIINFLLAYSVAFWSLFSFSVWSSSRIREMLHAMLQETVYLNGYSAVLTRHRKTHIAPSRSNSICTSVIVQG
jgi:hypothetical protein